MARPLQTYPQSSGVLKVTPIGDWASSTWENPGSLSANFDVACYAYNPSPRDVTFPDPRAYTEFFRDAYTINIFFIDDIKDPMFR